MVRKRAVTLVVLWLASAHLEAQLIETLAGGSVNDGFPAVLGALGTPEHLVVAANGDLYVADSGHHRVRKVDAASGVITTVAGTGESGRSGDGGPATAARLDSPRGVALDAAGNLFIADARNHVVRRVDRVTGTIGTVAGNGTAGFGGDDGPAILAMLSLPHGLAVSAAGDLFIADAGNGRVRRVSGGLITTFAGTGAGTSTGDGGPATAASFRSVSALLFDSGGSLLVADPVGNTVRRISPGGTITAFAGSGAAGFAGDDGPATAAALSSPGALARDAAGSILVGDTLNARVRRVAAGSGVITTVAGTGNSLADGDGGPATAARIGTPAGLAVGPLGQLYIADSFNAVARVVDGTTALISRAIGPPDRGDGGLAVNAALSQPAGVARFGNRLYVADHEAYVVRAVDLDTGLIGTVAGTGSRTGTPAADGAPATEMPMEPLGLAVDGAGNLYIAAVSRVFRVSAGTGAIATLAGNGSGGDGTPAATADLGSAQDVAVDAANDVYIADSAQHRVRRISAQNGLISTVAGTGTAGFGGDGGPATLAALREPGGIGISPSGDLYVADTSNGRVRRVDAVTRAMTTVAGNGSVTDSGNGGPAVEAGIRFPNDVAVEAGGDLIIASSTRLRRVAAATQRITTVAGNQAGYLGDGGPATAALLDGADFLVVDASGALIFSDARNDRVRAASCAVLSPPALFTPVEGDTTTSTNVLLSWGDAPFATSYAVHLDTVNPPARVAAEVTGTGYSALSLAPGTRYYWSIAARSDPPCPPSSVRSPVRSFRTPSACDELTDTQVCLGGERFLVTGTYRLESGGSGPLKFTRFTNDSAYFVFDNPNDAQALVKVLNVCIEPFQAIWVFIGALTDQEVNLRVTDTRTGVVKSYTNPLKRPFPPIQDTQAFKTCP